MLRGSGTAPMVEGTQDIGIEFIRKVNWPKLFKLFWSIQFLWLCWYKNATVPVTLILLMITHMGVFLSVNPKTDFRSWNGFRVPFGKSKSRFLIPWILYKKWFIGFEIRRIQIHINGLVIYAVPFTVDPKLVSWCQRYFQLQYTRVSSLLPFAAVKHLKTLRDCSWYSKISTY